MADVTLGRKGLVNADLVLVQGASFACAFSHEDADGEPIAHDGWEAWCRVQGGGVDLALDGCVSFGGGDVLLTVPDDVTAALPLGSYGWDLMVRDAGGFVTRLAWGTARVYDSYARD